jgi:hypothetical protein
MSGGPSDRRRSRVRISSAAGRALDGTPYRLPGDLPGAVTLVVVAFRQRQQADVDRWIELAVTLGVPPSPYGASQPMASAVVEVPVLGRRYLAARRVIDGGMAAGIADPVALARTITVYTDPTAFRRACGITTADEVSALLARRDGTVGWHAVGPPTEQHRLDLRDALAAAGPSGDPGDDGPVG